MHMHACVCVNCMNGYIAYCCQVSTLPTMDDVYCAVITFSSPQPTDNFISWCEGIKSKLEEILY